MVAQIRPLGGYGTCHANTIVAWREKARREGVPRPYWRPAAEPAAQPLYGHTQLSDFRNSGAALLPRHVLFPPLLRDGATDDTRTVGWSGYTIDRKQQQLPALPQIAPAAARGPLRKVEAARAFPTSLPPLPPM